MPSQCATSYNHFLLVDDIPSNLITISIILDTLGYTYDHAFNGLEAVEKFHPGKYTAIFMDIEMPVMNGYDACREIRKFENDNDLGTTQILIVTANPATEVQERTAGLNISHIVSKPFTTQEFLNKVQAVAA